MDVGVASLNAQPVFDKQSFRASVASESLTSIHTTQSSGAPIDKNSFPSFVKGQSTDYLAVPAPESYVQPGNFDFPRASLEALQAGKGSVLDIMG